MKTLALMFCCLALAAAATAAPSPVTLYVSPQGRDDWPGRADKPLATLAGARDRVRALRRRGALAGKSVTVLVRGGVYPLAEPLAFTPADSGTAGAPVVYAAYPGETPVISGGRAITGWRAAPNGLWVADVPQDAGKPWEFRQLFVGATRRPRTVLPKTGFHTIADAAPPSQAGKAADGFHYGAGEFDPKWHNLDDVEAKCYHIWSMSRMRISSLDEQTHLVRFTGTTCSTDYWAALPKGNRFQVENVFEALPDQPGAWYLDRRAGLVYYHPLPGEKRETFAPVAPRLTRLVDFQGDRPQKRWVSDITLRGLSFQHADWTLARSGYSCPQAEMEQPAADFRRLYAGLPPGKLRDHARRRLRRRTRSGHSGQCSLPLPPARPGRRRRQDRGL